MSRGTFFFFTTMNCESRHYHFVGKEAMELLLATDDVNTCMGSSACTSGDRRQTYRFVEKSNYIITAESAR